ncbi:MAG: Fic family protein [Marmoricola sp.]
MLYDFPALKPRDLAVIEAIDSYRQELRYFMSAPRRWKGQLRRNLRARAMRGSNSIEGYEVSLDDAIALLENDDEALDADQRTVLEVTGYRNAMTYVIQLAEDPHFHFDASLVRSLHFMMLGHDLSKSPGSYRQSTIYVRDDDLGEIVYEGPDADDVHDLMTELLEQLEHLDDHSGEHPLLVTAAMAHLNLVMIHPFRDGNGRMARCLQTLILSRNQVLGAEFASIEEWLGRNTLAYYDVLAKTGHGNWSPERDAAEWIEFNLRAHHMQAQTVWHRVKESEGLWIRLEDLAKGHKLPERAISGLFTAALGLRLRRPAYQEEVDLESGTANRDLKAMVAAGLLHARGETRGRYYVGTPGLRAVYAQVRESSRSKLVDPYTADLGDLVPSKAVVSSVSR